jgi:hypothetical protein
VAVDRQAPVPDYKNNREMSKSLEEVAAKYGEMDPARDDQKPEYLQHEHSPNHEP